MRLCAVRHDIHANGERDFGIDAEPEIIRFEIEVLVHRRRLAQLDGDLCAGHRKALAGTYVKRHTAPSPRINLQSQCGERLYFGALFDARFIEVSAELSP